jgi:predicted chitinase
MENQFEHIFDNIKKEGLYTKFTQLEVDSINAICNEIEAFKLTDNKQIAYIFATAYHESCNVKTGQRIVPIIEGGGTKYLQSKKYFPYYGRGFVQLTWDYNYKKYSTLTKLDLLKYPDKVLDVNVSAFVLVHGMVNGAFTGRKLSSYKQDDKYFLNCRRIINGTDAAAKIAGYAERFLKCLDN